MFNIDEIWIDLECPACSYPDVVLMLEIRLESLVWCHNCKQQIQLNDADASVDAGKKQIDTAMNELNKILKKIK
ncbi:hypothetical protein ACFS5N_05825 [Mucilaginibacter ximonensis]|uniref:Uncharacterized protein n=1 Tax=Mucilaginibacter ximonensis TaxID=538021 RepID=A0ABW5Y9G8_9SPHI